MSVGEKCRLNRGLSNRDAGLFSGSAEKCGEPPSRMPTLMSAG